MTLMPSQRYGGLLATIGNGTGGTLPEPQESQRWNYPEALERDCGTCYAVAGEPCRPMSLSIPHRARCEGEDR